MKRIGLCGMMLAFVLALAGLSVAENLLPDPSFEKPMSRNRWGHVFGEWGGNIYEGNPTFEVGQVVRTGKHSCEMVGTVGGKIRIGSKPKKLETGRYRVVAYLRGLDIGKGRWGRTIDFSMLFDGKYPGIKLTGNFGWTPVTYVVDVPEDAKPVAVYFGLWEEGHLWVDDVTLEKVGDDVALTPEPVVGREEAPIRMPGELGTKVVRCPHCAYRNNPAWGKCYACSVDLKTRAKALTSPLVKVFADFEDGRKAPFSAGVVVEEHATSGRSSLRLDKSYSSIDTPLDFSDRALDFSEHDYIHFDVFNPQDAPAKMLVEIRDALTRNYWTRVNFNTVVPPGKSTVTLPTAIYVGEKSRPGRMLVRNKITRFVVGIGNNGPVFLDNFRLERLNTAEITFDELLAFDFGPQGSPLMEGFAAAGMGTNYSKGRGYGWTKVNWWRDFNVLQPDLLYQDFVCPHQGTFRADLPNGKYRVWMNIDSPGGFWGEVQLYRNRKVLANGEPKVDEGMDLASFRKKYFRNASREDLPGIDTFDEYVENMFGEKSFDVEVTDGTLELSFSGQSWAISLSALVIYPESKKVQGDRFLAWVAERRRKQFEDYFKQVVPKRVGVAKPDVGYVLFRRDIMNPAQAHDGPRQGEEIKPDAHLELTVAKGEQGYLTFALQPGADLGRIDVAVGELKNEGDLVLDAAALAPGWIDYRVTRLEMDGSIYNVQPRYWHPTPAAASSGVTRNFWVRVKTPVDAASGTYSGAITVKPEKGRARKVPVRIRVLPFALDPITDVAVGPWGSSITLPWYGNDPAVGEWNRSMFEKALDVLRETGCTSFSARPHVRVSGRGGRLTIDTTRADREMALIRAKGFKHIISNYGAGIAGYRMYGLPAGPDDAAAKRFGFASGEAFLRALYKELDDHAIAANWVPVAWNLCDEPLGPAIPGSVKNALAHRKAAQGLQRTTFMGATSMRGSDPKDPHHELVKALPIPSLNLHDEGSLSVIRGAGNGFSFYNGGNRWTFGRYMKFLVKKHNLKLRLTWHYNVVAGDPYYALDCREDDFCWYNTNASGELVPRIQFIGNLLPGLNDYRYLSTLERLLREKPNHPSAAAGRKLFADMMDLKAGTDRNRRVDYNEDRARIIAAIEVLLK